MWPTYHIYIYIYKPFARRGTIYVGLTQARPNNLNIWYIQCIFFLLLRLDWASFPAFHCCIICMLKAWKGAGNEARLDSHFMTACCILSYPVALRQLIVRCAEAFALCWCSVGTSGGVWIKHSTWKLNVLDPPHGLKCCNYKLCTKV